MVNAQNERVWIPAWQQTTSLSTARAGGAVIEVNGVIYAIGGINGNDFLTSTEYSRIGSDGTLSDWKTSSPLNEARGFFDIAVSQDYLYAVGGGNGPAGHHLLNSVERAKILADGSLGPWQTERTTLNYPRRCIKLIVANNRLYALGGFSGTLLDSVESAPLHADGSVGAWELAESKFTLPRYVHAAKKTPHSIIVVGGHNQKEGVGLQAVEWASLKSDNHTLQWDAAPPLITGRYGHSTALNTGYIYTIGGLGGIDYLRSIEKSKLNDITGAPAKWQESNPLSTPRANFGVVTYKTWIYILGGTNAEGYYNSVEYATFNTAGDIGFWGTKAQGKAYEQRETAAPEASITVGMAHQGTIVETVTAAGYSYLRVATPQGEEWLATSQGAFKPGDLIGYSAGVLMNNFHSRGLKREFTVIRFVSRVEHLQ